MIVECSKLNVGEQGLGGDSFAWNTGQSALVVAPDRPWSVAWVPLLGSDPPLATTT